LHEHLHWVPCCLPAVLASPLPPHTVGWNIAGTVLLILNTRSALHFCVFLPACVSSCSLPFHCHLCRFCSLPGSLCTVAFLDTCLPPALPASAFCHLPAWAASFCVLRLRSPLTACLPACRSGLPRLVAFCLPIATCTCLTLPALCLPAACCLACLPAALPAVLPLCRFLGYRSSRLTVCWILAFAHTASAAVITRARAAWFCLRFAPCVAVAFLPPADYRTPRLRLDCVPLPPAVLLPAPAPATLPGSLLAVLCLSGFGFSAACQPPPHASCRRLAVLHAVRSYCRSLRCICRACRCARVAVIPAALPLWFRACCCRARARVAS